MKKKIFITVIIVIAVMLVLLLFLPYKRCYYDDGGSCEYIALTYKIVKWKRGIAIYSDEDGKIERIEIYQKTAIYWYPDNQKDLDELWEIEIGNK